jgi:hypothetical protein
LSYMEKVVFNLFIFLFLFVKFIFRNIKQRQYYEVCAEVRDDAKHLIQSTTFYLI